MKIWREKRGFVSCETLTPDILPYTNPWDTQFSHKHIPCPCRALWTIRYLGTYPGAPGQSLHGKGRVRTPLLIHNCNVKDRDWQSCLAGETILGEKFNQLREGGCRLQPGRPFYDSALTHRDILSHNCFLFEKMSGWPEPTPPSWILAGRRLSDSLLTHRVKDMIFVSSITVSAAWNYHFSF